MKTLSDETLHRVACFLKAMAEPTRLKILRSLHDHEKRVTELIRDAGAHQSNVSKHLSVLSAMNIVTSRRDGTSVYFRITDPNIVAICDTVCRSIADKIRQQNSLLKNIESTVPASRPRPASKSR